MDILKIKTKSNLLRRQIKKYLKNLTPEEFSKLSKFIESVDMEYADMKEDRTFLERTVDLNSKELWEKNKKLEDILEKNIKINEKLENSRFHLQTIIDNLWEWLMVIDSDKKIIMANNKASFLSGFLTWELIWKKYDENIKFLLEDKKSENFILSTLEEGKEYVFYKWVNLRWRNKTIPIFVTSTPLKDYYWDDKKTAWVVVFRDATKQRELENLKNDFLSVASHELRTPMTVINGYIWLFIKWKLWEVTENQKKYLEKIQSNTKNLIDLVNDMLDINKLEAWKMDFTYTDFNLKHLIFETISEMQELYSNKNISLEFSVDNLKINSDYKKIKQVIINLLSNSYKFTPENWEVIVKTNISKDKKNVIISVIDNWIWIEKENIKKLFKKFTQVWSHLNKTEKWTWLWLSLSKKIIGWLGWKIWVKSVYEEWSIFYFSLIIKKGTVH